MRNLTALCLLSLLACDDGGTADNVDLAAAPDARTDAAAMDAAPSDAALSDAAPDAALDAAVDAMPDAGTLTPSDYCEATADIFCPFYERCDRMAVPADSTCRAVFLENCNAVYEPIYAGLADAGLLALDPAGIERCAAHLEQVACAAQIFDLDGPCAGIWVGQAPGGAACAPGIESFVCAPGNDCVIGLDFCGTCEPAAGVGAACDDDTRCTQSARCVDGMCQARVLPGMPCGEAGCVIGTRCVDEVCVGPARAGIGESCANRERCPYRSACVGGVCVGAGLLGDACDATTPCASGACVDGRCVAPTGPGTPCERGSTCVGGVCDAGRCAAIPGMCFER